MDMIPSRVDCPLCLQSTPWAVLVRELTLRATPLADKIRLSKKSAPEESSEPEFDIDDDDFWADERDSDDAPSPEPDVLANATPTIIPDSDWDDVEVID
jgi:hypothetical protein